MARRNRLCHDVPQLIVPAALICDAAQFRNFPVCHQF
jgi:hypothetical protein